MGEGSSSEESGGVNEDPGQLVWDFQQFLLWKNFAHPVHGIGLVLLVNKIRHPPHLLSEEISGCCWAELSREPLDFRDKMALLMPWMCWKDDLPRSLNMGRTTCSANQTGPKVESGILKLPWICTRRVV